MRFETAHYLREKTKLPPPIKRVLGLVVFFIIVVFILWPVHSAKAENNEADHETKQRLKQIEEIEEKEEEEEVRQGALNPIVQEIFGEKVRLNGGVEFNYEYLDVEDIGDENSDSSSDFFMSTAELALRVFFNEWSKTKIVVAAEDVGQQGEDGKIRLDEAILTLQSIGMPLYFIGGKTVMPFGVFEDHLIEGTLAEDLYEIDEWGATLGINPDFYGLDLSFSVYKDPQVIENLQNEDTHGWAPGRQKEDKFRSYIANVTLEPIEDTLALSAFYSSEPGDGNRNQSIGGAFTLNYWKFTLDAEYITALTREKGENEEENKESARVVGLAFDLLDSLQLATRYEVFSDDTRGDQDEVVDYRIISGFNYSLLELTNVSFLTEALLSFEYRYSKFEKETGSEATNSQNMFMFQLTLGF
ncbi:MAG: outer membrane beta-barrel protein [Desulfobacterales bacterium]|jgi:hypothetical protein